MQRYRARTGVSAARAAAATVLLDLHTGLYHTLNGPAGRLWDAIESGDATLADLVDVLHAEHGDVPPETIENDVVRLLATLLEAGVITVEQDRSNAVAHGEAEGGAP